VDSDPLIPKHVLDSLTPAEDPVGELGGAQFSPQDLARIEQIASSQTWDYLEKGIRSAREALLSSTPKSTDALWMTWGRIAQLSDLLHGGPMLVLEYSKMAERRRDQPASSVDGEVSHVHVHTYKGE
jgi:hypothetical protein